MTTAELIGARLKALREERCLSQETIAQRMQSYRQLVRRIEKGTHEATLTTYERYAKALEVSLVWDVLSVLEPKPPVIYEWGSIMVPALDQPACDLPCAVPFSRSHKTVLSGLGLCFENATSLDAVKRVLASTFVEIWATGKKPLFACPAAYLPVDGGTMHFAVPLLLASGEVMTLRASDPVAECVPTMVLPQIRFVLDVGPRTRIIA